MRTAALALLALGSYAFAGTINGTVTNKTTGKPSSGDSVSLLSLTGAMDEVGSAKTDATGHFTLKTPSDQQPFLIKVEHEKGAYFKNMPPGVSTADITVYDVAAKVEGVSTEADVLRVETDNGQLKITENYFVRNTSSPPRTQASDHTFEVVLPADATLEGAATVGPSNMPISATPDPVGAKGHYAFNFPIRPNEGELGTRFQLSYHIAYSGSYTFKPVLMENVENFVVMLPKSMKFTSGSGATFQPVPDDTAGQTLLAKNVTAKQALAFTVSGEGQMPRDAGQAASGDSSGGTMGGPQAADQGTSDASGPGGKPGGGLGVPIDTPDPLTKYKWWILSGLGLLLVAAAAFLLRKPAGSVNVPPAPSTAALAAHTHFQATAMPPSSIPPAAKGQLLLDALKEEMFALESDKINDKISPDDYAQTKAALEIVLKRALTHQKR